MHRSLAIHPFTRAFHWKIVGKHFSSMTSFLSFQPQAQIGIEFWNSRLWNARCTHTHFRVFLAWISHPDVAVRTTSLAIFFVLFRQVKESHSSFPILFGSGFTALTEFFSSQLNLEQKRRALASELCTNSDGMMSQICSLAFQILSKWWLPVSNFSLLFHWDRIHFRSKNNGE